MKRNVNIYFSQLQVYANSFSKQIKLLPKSKSASLISFSPDFSVNLVKTLLKVLDLQNLTIFHIKRIKSIQKITFSKPLFTPTLN